MPQKSAPNQGKIRGRWWKASPARLFFTSLLWIFAVEIFTMWAIEGQRAGHFSEDAIVDALSLILVVAPVIYLSLYRPMIGHIRERERAEEALRGARDGLEQKVAQRTADLEASNRHLREEAEERQRADRRAEFQSELLDRVEQSVIATDLVGQILFWNRSSEALYGWKAEEVRGRNLSELFPCVAGCEPAEDGFAAARLGRHWTGERELRRREGELFPAHVSCFPVFDDQRLPAGVVHLSMDITGRKDAASALEYSEKKYSTLVENSPTGIFIGRDGKIVFVNPKLAEITGYAREEFETIDWLDLIHPDDRARMQEISTKRQAGEEAPTAYSCRIVNREGAVRWVAVRAAPISYRGALSIIGSVEDVTEAKEAERALNDSKEQLRLLSSRVLTAQEDERRRVARELHDSIGQSLSAIKFVVERALEGTRSEERRREAPALRAVIPTIQDAVEEVRRISMALRPSILDDLGVLATFGWFVRELQAAHPELRVETHLKLEERDVPEPLKIVLFRILQEATSNATKHSGATRIVVSLQRSDGALALTIQDDGVGFDPDQAGRAGAKKGLGLGTMRERTEYSEGAFSLESKVGSGTTVRASWTLTE